MHKYKYTFQNWQDGEIELEELIKLGGRQELDLDYFNYFDVLRIYDLQRNAFVKRMQDLFEIRKRLFKSRFDNKLLRDDFLQDTITEIELLVQKIKFEKKEIYNDAINGNDGRDSLTSKQIREYSEFDIDKLNRMFQNRLLWKYHILNPDEEKITPITYIVNVNFLKWLYWFKGQTELDKTEPCLSTLGRTEDEELLSKIPDAMFKGKLVSYTWLGNDDELPELYQILKDKSFIHPDTTLEQFEVVFTAKPIIQGMVPIKWHDDNASELLYFILQLEDSDNIEKSSRANYKRLQACFVKPDGSPFDSAFKSLKQRLNDELSEQKQQAIRDIISNF